MKLGEAINYCEEISKKVDCMECAQDHAQLAEWLKELQHFKTGKKEKVMKAYFRVENFLYGNGKDKSIEIQSAMIWGALMVAHYNGDIDWNTTRELFGEFMSKKMGVQ